MFKVNNKDTRAMHSAVWNLQKIVIFELKRNIDSAAMPDKIFGAK